MARLVLGLVALALALALAIAFCHYNAEHVQPNPFMEIWARARAGSCMVKEIWVKG